MISRRRALGLLASAVPSVAAVRFASAAEYPARPVRFVVGYPPDSKWLNMIFTSKFGEFSLFVTLEEQKK